MNTKNLSSRSKPAKPAPKVPSVAGVTFVRTMAGISEYRLKNGLTILYVPIPDTGVVTTNITYVVGSKDEARGETGLAHMLEHMLFKPTTADLAARRDSGAMLFERETGCILNANTAKDRTTYFFSYPTEHVERALAIEADRMANLVLADEEFLPERGNVLSEFDMYFGMPEFALSVAMSNAALCSHPYRHEVIGFREDIEAYTVEKLTDFYRAYYRPDNATLMIIGDVDHTTALTAAKRAFGAIPTPATPIHRVAVREPKQEGERRVSVTRESTTNLLSFGVKHPGFPTAGWQETWLALSVLASGPESILHKLLIDTGLATHLDFTLEPTREDNVALLTITLSGLTHDVVEQKVRAILARLTYRDIRDLVSKLKIKDKTTQQFTRTSSLGIAQELTEYVAAGDWTAYTTSLETLEVIDAKAVFARMKQLFTPTTLTIGRFIGTSTV